MKYTLHYIKGLCHGMEWYYGGTLIKRIKAGTMSYTTFGTRGEGGDEGDKISKCHTLTYLRSVLISIKQYSDSMCFSSIFS